MRASSNKTSKTMKRNRLIIHLVSLAFACLLFAGCATNQAGPTAGPPPANSGHLLVYRVANFGSNLSLILSVDGKDLGAFTEGRNYDGYLSAGQHVLSARIDPNPGGVSPWRKTLTVQAGQTYSYTASWSGQKLLLQRNR